MANPGLKQPLDDNQTYVHIRIPAQLKRDIIKHLTERGFSWNDWITEVIKYGLRTQKGLPEPPRALAPLPTPAEEIRAWAEGRKILTPCGKLGECYGTTHPPDMSGTMGFCAECQIRVV